MIANFLVVVALVACSPAGVKRVLPTHASPAAPDERATLRAEIAIWEGVWSVARSCLVPALAPDVRDALDLQTSAHDETPVCSGQLAAIAPHTNDRWMALDEAVARLRTMREPPHDGDARPPIGPGELADAIRDIDDWLVALRAVAGMPATPIATRVPLATVVSSVPVRVFHGVGHALARREFEPSYTPTVVDHVLVADAGDNITVFASAPDRIFLKRDGVPKPEPQVFAHSWVAKTLQSPGTAAQHHELQNTAIVARQLHPDGSVADGSVVVFHGAAEARAAIGEAQHRIVLLQIGKALAVVESRDGGSHWTVPARRAPGSELVEATSDSFDLLEPAPAPSHAAQWVHVTVDDVRSTALQLARYAEDDATCTAHATWDFDQKRSTKVADSARLRWDAGKHNGVVAVEPAHQLHLVTCAGDVVLVRFYDVATDREKLMRCTQAGCAAPIDRGGGWGAGGWADLTSDGIVEASYRGHIVRIFQTGKPTSDLRLADREIPAGLVVFQDVPHILVIGTDDIHFVRASTP